MALMNSDVLHVRSRYLRVYFLVVIVIIINNSYEWPYAIRFLDVQLIFWALSTLGLICPVLIVFLGQAVLSRILRYFKVLAGIVLLIPTILSDTGYELQNSLAIGPITYRVYVNQIGGAFFPPFTVLRKERDTIFGVKFVRTIWSEDHYGIAILRVVNTSTLEVVTDGEIRVRFDI